MVKTPEDLMKLQADAFKASSEAANKTLEGFRKLAELNMQTAQAALEQSSEQVKALLAVKDAKTLTELVTSFAKPSPEKFTAYAKAVYAISSETGSDLAAMIEKQVAASNQQLAAAIEAMAKNAPPGAEGAVNFIKQAMGAASAAYEQVNSATKQFVDVAEANLGKATKAAGAKK
jgi:phasin family protein